MLVTRKIFRLLKSFKKTHSEKKTVVSHMHHPFCLLEITLQRYETFSCKREIYGNMRATCMNNSPDVITPCEV